jgi:hypothetical protein
LGEVPLRAELHTLAEGLGVEGRVRSGGIEDLAGTMSEVASTMPRAALFSAQID